MADDKMTAEHFYDDYSGDMDFELKRCVVEFAEAYAAHVTASLQAERDGLRVALNKLANESEGFLIMADLATHGITNINVFNQRIQEARAILAETELNKERCAAEKFKNGPPGGGDPIDCDFPFCGCYSMANQTLEALIECGWKSPRETESLTRQLAEARKGLEDQRKAWFTATDKLLSYIEAHGWGTIPEPWYSVSDLYDLMYDRCPTCHNLDRRGDRTKRDHARIPHFICNDSWHEAALSGSGSGK